MNAQTEKSEESHTLGYGIPVAVFSKASNSLVARSCDR